MKFWPSMLRFGWPGILRFTWPNDLRIRHFDYTSLPKIRKELWEWLVLTITSDEFDILSGSYKSDIILLYEMTEKLVEAAHVIYQRRQGGVA